jgi:energy-coupling factor transporter ATP-binding protein EcfA2
MIPVEVENKSNDKSLVGKVIEDLGGVVFAIQSSELVLHLCSSLFKNNKFYQETIKGLKKTLPAAITGYKVYNSVKNYYNDKGLKYTSQRKIHHIATLMRCYNPEEICTYKFHLGKEIVHWFLTKPATNKFKIIDFYNNDFEKVTKITESGCYYILMEYGIKKLNLIEIEIGLNNNILLLTNCENNTIGYKDNDLIRSYIFKEFIDRLDIKNNVIEYRPYSGMYSRPRKNINFNIDQFNMNAFSDEILKSIEKKKRRGYVFVGPAGVGKSTIVLKLENLIKDIPIVYIQANGEGTASDDIQNIFRFLRSITPCIAIFEDLDAYELTNKQDRVFSEFLEQLDGVKYNDCIIIISTMNEPENIHGSLLNRRGRIDRVFFIDYPKTEKEIYEILKNKYNQETNQLIPIKNITKVFKKKVLSYKLTHSDLCEIIEYLFINDLQINQSNLMKSLNVLIETKNAIIKCIDLNQNDIKEVVDIKGNQPTAILHSE